MPSVRRIKARSPSQAQKPCHIRSFKFQQLNLLFDSARISRQAAVFAHNSVARYHKRNGIVPYRASHRLRGHSRQAHPPGCFTGNFSVSHRFAERNRKHYFPNDFAERRGIQKSGGVKSGALPPKYTSSQRTVCPKTGKYFSSYESGRESPKYFDRQTKAPSKPLRCRKA